MGMWFPSLALIVSPSAPTTIKSDKIRLSVGATWLIVLILFLGRVLPATCLAVELGWKLPPILLQLAFDADVLWREKADLGVLSTSASKIASRRRQLVFRWKAGKLAFPRGRIVAIIARAK